MSKQLVSNDYGQLQEKIVRMLQEGKFLIEQSIVQETLRTYHGIGQVLDRYLLAHQNRAGYGEQTVVRLAQEVGLSKNSLYRALGFYRLRPIFPTQGKLTWTHYRALISLPTVEAQRLYEDATVENGWSVRELEAQIKSGAFETAAPVEQPAGTLSPDLNLPALRGQFS